MDDKPIFSIITVTRNHCEGLQRTGKSITLQSCFDYEWIIIDGASTDETANYLKSLDGKNIYIISEPDNGIYDAMNKGIDKACGDYIIFMNAGDVFADPDILDTIAEQISNDDFIYGDALESDKSGDIFYKAARPYTRINYGMITHHQSMFYNRELLGDMRYNEAYTIAADYDLTRRYLKHVERVRYLPLPICIFEHGGLSQERAIQGRKEQYDIRKSEIHVFKNKMIYVIQSLSLYLKTHISWLYRLLRK